MFWTDTPGTTELPTCRKPVIEKRPASPAHALQDMCLSLGVHVGRVRFGMTSYIPVDFGSP